MNYDAPISTRAQAYSQNAAPKPDNSPPKAYMIAHIDVSNALRYAQYQDIDDDAFARYGGRYIVRGGVQNPLVGSLKTRTVVVEFESLAVAVECYNSIENQSAKAVRLSVCCADAVIVEGCCEPS